MSEITEQDVLTVGASYHLRQRADNSGPNIAAICRDTGLSREVVKCAIKDLEENHKDWLAEYGELVMAEAKKELVSEEVTRLRSKMSNFANVVLDRTRDSFLKLHNDCQQAALNGGAKSDEEFQALKIKQFERNASLRVLSQLLGIVERLEAATQPKAAPVINNTNIQVPTEEKRNRFMRIGEFEPRADAA